LGVLGNGKRRCVWGKRRSKPPVDSAETLKRVALPASRRTIRIEAVYGRVLMDYVVLSRCDLSRASKVLSFVIPRFSMRYLDDPRFEFRVCSRGLNSFYLRSLSLKAIPRCKDDVELESLPLMSVGDAGKRMSNNSPGSECNPRLSSP
jgi:hypothetical protein